MPPLVLVVDDCRAAYERLLARGGEFTQEPTERYGSVDANFRDPSGNGCKMIKAEKRREPGRTGHGGRDAGSCLDRDGGSLLPDLARGRTGQRHVEQECERKSRVGGL